MRVGLSTDEHWTLSAPAADGEWIERIYSEGCAYDNSCGYHAIEVDNLIFNYTGVVEVAYTVLPRPVAQEHAHVVPCVLRCDGTPQTCELVITNDYTGAILVEGIDYDVVYSNNVLPGFASAVVTCKGNYTGAFSREFEILPSTNIVEVLGLDNVWVTGGDAEWFTEWTEEAHDGTNHLHSGAIGDGQVSWIETVVTNAGVLSFWWRASSESYRGVAYDKLVFTVDGAVPESVPPIGGETDWSNVVCVVEGSGPHVLRWTYQKDESDFVGEDCAWLDDVQYLHQVRVVFADGGATGGAAPETMAVGEGFTVTLPGQGGMSWPKHRFLGWTTGGGTLLEAGSHYALGYDDVLFTAAWEEKRIAAPTISVASWYDAESTTVSISCETPGASIRYTLDGSEPAAAGTLYAGPFVLAGSATIRAVAMMNDWFDSDVVSATSVRAPWTPDECLNAAGLVFRNGGDAVWARDRSVSHDGEASMRSGDVGDGQTSWIETEVSGSGTLTFWWRASSEAYKGTLYDKARFTVDGAAVVPDIGGEAGWRSETVAITGAGIHVLRWIYLKDSQDSSGEDCAWLDEVTWTPSPDPIPALAADATADAVTNAVQSADFADAGVMEAIGGDAARYVAFKEWAGSVKEKGSDEPAGEESVVASLNAAVSWLLGAEALFENEPEITIAGMEMRETGRSEIAPYLAVTVIVRDGDDAAIVSAEKVATMFEATSDLRDWDGAAKLEPIVAESSRDPGGTLHFTVVPGNGSASSAFLRIKVK